MIFVTVGTQLPFDRLIDAMNEIAGNLSEPVIAQSGCVYSENRFPNLDIRPMLAPVDFGRLFASARVIVGHTGIGTLLSAAQHGKPFVTVPRRSDLGEHRNDHQIATANRIGNVPGVKLVLDLDHLASVLALPLTPVQFGQNPRQDQLARRIRAFVFHEGTVAK